MQDNAHIQFQQISGNWVTVTTTMNESTVILNQMQSLKASMPECRVRAIDDQGRLLDMLG